ncbi:hypothetical protein [Stigmatella hybrida]|uniref:hypothetical protein n=1 Tax=Stigmatella hybrida TaxID=394097 RepID=UPI001CDA8111|nr:hypothetical protein [Stigmatella hybrida]
MGKERRAGPVEVLRNLALSLERMAAREAASGMVRGAAEGMREELPELDGQLRTLLQDALTVLGRMAHEAAERERVEPGAAAHSLAAAAMQGVVEVLEQEWQDGGLPFHALVERVNRLLDEVIAFARSRTDEIRTPGDRAQAMAEGVVRAAVRELREAMPGLVEDVRTLAPGGGEIASRVGRGLVEGIESKLREDSEVLEGLLERAGRGLVRGLAGGIREELASHPLASGKALGKSLEELAERSAAAIVRGVGGELKAQVRPWRDALRRNGALRRAGRELTGGMVEALGTGLRRPLLAAAGAGSALVAFTLLSVRWRRA